MTDQAMFYLCEALILIGFIPVMVMFFQYALVGFNRFYNHYSECKSDTPRVAVIIPAWNEAEVIKKTVQMLLLSNYDLTKLRIFLIDDASTDATPAVGAHLTAEYPNNFIYLRREQGGEGKAHTLNYGLSQVLSNDWAEAILIVDSDIIFEPDALNKMVRHLSDPKIGCVTCYIKEDTTPGTLISRYVAYEYIISESVVRRAQNVLGVLACVAGGAQLHSRANIEALGGKIDSSTFAEDTHTTFMTQMLGRKAIFDGNAVVRSEEPTTISALWRQRKRWGRGNIQLTKMFKSTWFHVNNKSGLGGVGFGLIWFSILLLPFLMVLVTLGLLGTLFLYPGSTWYIFELLAGTSVFIYLFITLYTFFVDDKTLKRTWFEAFTFPGLISMCSLFIVFAPHTTQYLFGWAFPNASFDYWQFVYLVFVSCWVSACMFFAWVVYRLDRMGLPQFITNPLLVLVGYGPLLCSITLAAFVSEFTKREAKWDKTEKMGTVPIEQIIQAQPYNFVNDLELDQKVENKLYRNEIVLFIVLIVLFIIRYVVGF